MRSNRALNRANRAKTLRARWGQEVRGVQVYRVCWNLEPLGDPSVRDVLVFHRYPGEH